MVISSIDSPEESGLARDVIEIDQEGIMHQLQKYTTDLWSPIL